ncbi:hypothetical protein FB639_002662, partial [Coemansia asiatica]
MTERQQSTARLEDADKELTPFEILSSTNIEPIKTASNNDNTDTNNDRQHYRLKPITWTDPLTMERKQVKIVTQNENGPCPLISLTNALVLTGRLHLGKRPVISDEELLGLLGNHLFSRETVGGWDIEEILGLLPTLTHGLDVEIRLTDIYGFIEGPATRLFRAFDVPLVHGWVVEDGAVARIVREKCQGSYTGLVDFVLRKDAESNGRVVGNRGEDLAEDIREAVLANLWLESNQTQLTEYGRQRLLNALEDFSVVVFFRNNHFSTLYKRSQGLYILCADDVMAGDSRVVWESVCDVRQQGNLFFDSEFNVLSRRDDDGADYARESADEDEKQVDEDYRLAVELQRMEDEGSASRERQQRQNDGLAAGMTKGSPLYAVPKAEHLANKSTGHHGRSASVEDFEKRINKALVPAAEDASKTMPARRAHQQQYRQ